MDIPDLTYRKLKSKAAAEGSSVKNLILRSVERELDVLKAPRAPIKLPIVRSRRPGCLRLTNEQMYDAIPFP